MLYISYMEFHIHKYLLGKIFILYNKIKEDIKLLKKILNYFYFSYCEFSLLSQSYSCEVNFRSFENLFPLNIYSVEIIQDYMLFTKLWNF